MDCEHNHFDPTELNSNWVARVRFPLLRVADLGSRRGQPAIYSQHYLGTGSAEELTTGLKAALSELGRAARHTRRVKPSMTRLAAVCAGRVCCGQRRRRV